MRKNICTLSGVVIKGRQVGHTIGFPTANLSLDYYFPTLPLGVYGVTVYMEAKKYDGVMNVGCRPTFDDGFHVSHEVHLFDFDDNLYGKELSVEVCFYVRPEKEFLSINELKRQIIEDVAFVKKQMVSIEFEYH